MTALEHHRLDVLLDNFQLALKSEKASNSIGAPIIDKVLSSIERARKEIEEARG